MTKQPELSNWKILIYALGPANRVGRLKNVRDRILVNRVKRATHQKLAFLMLTILVTVAVYVV